MNKPKKKPKRKPRNREEEQFIEMPDDVKQAIMSLSGKMKVNK